MKNSQKIAAGVLAAAVVTSGVAALPALHMEAVPAGIVAFAANDAITISNGTVVPDAIEQGKDAVQVAGVVNSEDSNITSVTVGIYDSSRKLVTGKSALPKAKSYDISKLNAYVSFSQLAPGSYTYMVFATNGTNTNYVLTNKSFTITAPAAATPAETAPATQTEEAPATTPAATTTDTMSISNGTSLPATLKKGKFVVVKGTVVSAESNITSLTVGIYDKDGKMVCGKTAEPNAKTYNVNKLDNAITFNKLDNGNYTYKVTATNKANKDFVVVSQNFAVSDGTTPASNTNTSTPAANTETPVKATMSIANGTDVPATLKKGQPVLVRGVVTSETNISSITVGIYDTTGKLVSGKTAIPNAKTYDVSKLDNYIEFNKLTDGTYAYMIFANNEVNKNYIMVNKAFTVGQGGQVASDAIAIANGTEVPSSIAKGKCVSVKGTVASANSNLTSLTVGVYDKNGTMLTGKTVQPNAKTYNLHKLDSAVTFNKLPAGAYTYKVIATNSANKDFEIVKQEFNVSDGTDVLTIKNGTDVPDTLKKGSPVSVKGVVSSSSSNLTSVTVGVYDNNKKLVTGKTAVPNAKTYDVSKLDNFVEFNKLTDGTYTYMVFASNSGNSNYVIVNDNFTVGKATSTNTNTNSSTTTNKGVTLTNGTSIPETIAKGKCVSVKGVVSSNDTIKAVTVAVYNSNNKLVTSKSVAPQSKSFDLKELDKYIEFNKLGTGSYTYRVAVTTTANKDVTADRQTFKVK